MPWFEIKFQLGVIDNGKRREGSISFRIITAQDQEIAAKIAEAMLGEVIYRLERGPTTIFLEKIQSIESVNKLPWISSEDIRKTWERVLQRLGLSLSDENVEFGFIAGGYRARIAGIILFTSSQREKFLKTEILPAEPPLC